MMDINLLPWRFVSRIRQSRQFVVYGILSVICIAMLFIYLEYTARQRILIQDLKNKQLEQRILRLKASYQKKMSAYHQQTIGQSKEHIDETNQAESALQSELIQINYAKASDLAGLLKDKTTLFLSDRGTLTFDPRTNVIWIQDTIPHVRQIKSLLKQLDVPHRQVSIEARLVNMSKDCAEDLGVRFGLLRAAPGFDPDGNANFPEMSTNRVSDRLNIDLGAIPLEANPAAIGIAVAMLGKNVLLDMELSALESEGRAEIIARPRLITTNQETAVIESGEDIPYQEYTTSGATSVAFKKAVLSLKVIPQITSDGKLMMALSINQDADSGRRVQGVPIILTKSIETNVLVNNGQTIVLGGIYKQDKNNSIARVPFLGELPVIGRLFRRTQVRVRNEELLIFITPKIIISK